MAFPTEHCGPIMNDLPTPKGCWYTAYAKKQKLYNRTLYGGLAFCFISLVTVSQCVVLNFGPKNIKLTKEDFDDVL